MRYNDVLQQSIDLSCFTVCLHKKCRSLNVEGSTRVNKGQQGSTRVNKGQQGSTRVNKGQQGSTRVNKGQHALHKERFYTLLFAP